VPENTTLHTGSKMQLRLTGFKFSDSKKDDDLQPYVRATLVHQKGNNYTDNDPAPFADLEKLLKLDREGSIFLQEWTLDGQKAPTQSSKGALTSTSNLGANYTAPDKVPATGSTVQVAVKLSFKSTYDDTKKLVILFSNITIVDDGYIKITFKGKEYLFSQKNSQDSNYQVVMGFVKDDFDTRFFLTVHGEDKNNQNHVNFVCELRIDNIPIVFEGSKTYPGGYNQSTGGETKFVFSPNGDWNAPDAYGNEIYDIVPDGSSGICKADNFAYTPVSLTLHRVREIKVPPMPGMTAKVYYYEGKLSVKLAKTYHLSSCGFSPDTQDIFIEFYLQGSENFLN
jgi:hypothetical protein